MNKELPLWHKLYFWPHFTEIVRAVGYAGCLYRDLWKLLEPIADQFGKTQVESATWHLLTFEGQMTVNPKPLAKVELRAEVRGLAWQLLGPPPEHEAAFYRNADGSENWPEWKRRAELPNEQPTSRMRKKK